MSFYMMAPHNLPQTLMELPSPELGDDRKIHGELLLKESLAGGIRTYVRKTTRERMTFTFFLDYPKAMEVKAFFRVYMAETLRVIDHQERTYKATLIPSTLDITILRRPQVSFQLDMEYLNG